MRVIHIQNQKETAIAKVPWERFSIRELEVSIQAAFDWTNKFESKLMKGLGNICSWHREDKMIGWLLRDAE